MEDIQKSLLGDQEASKRLTEAGVLVPCPFCGGKVYENQWEDIERGGIRVVMQCTKCNIQTPVSVSVRRARLAWNTRAPILSESELKKLEETT